MQSLPTDGISEADVRQKIAAGLPCESGEEWLIRARIQAESIPDIMIAQLESADSAAEQRPGKRQRELASSPQEAASGTAYQQFLAARSAISAGVEAWTDEDYTRAAARAAMATTAMAVQGARAKRKSQLSRGDWVALVPDAPLPPPLPSMAPPGYAKWLQEHGKCFASNNANAAATLMAATAETKDTLMLAAGSTHAERPDQTGEAAGTRCIRTLPPLSCLQHWLPLMCTEAALPTLPGAIMPRRDADEVASTPSAASESLAATSGAAATAAEAVQCPKHRCAKLWRPPTLGVVCRLDDVACNTLLDELAQWLLERSAGTHAATSDSSSHAEDWTADCEHDYLPSHAAVRAAGLPTGGLSPGTCMWAFALLARLGTPVVTSTLASIRDLATACSRLGGVEAAMLVDICGLAFGQHPST